jgi:threonine dehydrogenase-like Zn-dependent dehydrogenase
LTGKVKFLPVIPEWETSMRAAVFKAGGQPWVIEERPDPAPGPSEMVIKVGRCGICGSDVHMTAGTPHDFPNDRILGHEYSGEVVALGRDTTGFRVGDAITAMPSIGCGLCSYCAGGNQFLCQAERRSYMGGFAEYMNIAAHVAVKLPTELSLADGALVEPLAVGVHATGLVDIHRDSNVLVLGAGPIGLAVVHAARHLCARKIVIASRTNRRSALAAMMGADDFAIVSDSNEDVFKKLGGSPDFVFECVGLPGALDQSVDLVRSDGTIVSIGTCAVPDPVDVVRATGKQVRIIFSMGYTLEEFRLAVDRMASGSVSPRAMISATIPLAELPAIIPSLRSGSGHTKVHVDPWL